MPYPKWFIVAKQYVPATRSFVHKAVRLDAYYSSDGLVIMLPQNTDTKLDVLFTHGTGLILQFDWSVVAVNEKMSAEAVAANYYVKNDPRGIFGLMFSFTGTTSTLPINTVLKIYATVGATQSKNTYAFVSFDGRGIPTSVGISTVFQRLVALLHNHFTGSQAAPSGVCNAITTVQTNIIGATVEDYIGDPGEDLIGARIFRAAGRAARAAPAKFGRLARFAQRKGVALRSRSRSLRSGIASRSRALRSGVASRSRALRSGIASRGRSAWAATKTTTGALKATAQRTGTKALTKGRSAWASTKAAPGKLKTYASRQLRRIPNMKQLREKGGAQLEKLKSTRAGKYVTDKASALKTSASGLKTSASGLKASATEKIATGKALLTLAKNPKALLAATKNPSKAVTQVQEKMAAKGLPSTPKQLGRVPSTTKALAQKDSAGNIISGTMPGTTAGAVGTTTGVGTGAGAVASGGVAGAAAGLGAATTVGMTSSLGTMAKMPAGGGGGGASTTTNVVSAPSGAAGGGGGAAPRPQDTGMASRAQGGGGGGGGAAAGSRAGTGVRSNADKASSSGAEKQESEPAPAAEPAAKGQPVADQQPRQQDDGMGGMPPPPPQGGMMMPGAGVGVPPAGYAPVAPGDEDSLAAEGDGKGKTGDGGGTVKQTVSVTVNVPSSSSQTTPTAASPISSALSDEELTGQEDDLADAMQAWQEQSPVGGKFVYADDLLDEDDDEYIGDEYDEDEYIGDDMYDEDEYIGDEYDEDEYIGDDMYDEDEDNDEYKDRFGSVACVIGDNLDRVGEEDEEEEEEEEDGDDYTIHMDSAIATHLVSSTIEKACDRLFGPYGQEMHTRIMGDVNAVAAAAANGESSPYELLDTACDKMHDLLHELIMPHVSWSAAATARTPARPLPIFSNSSGNLM